MCFKNVVGPYPPFHSDILTGKTVCWNSSFPEAISHDGSLKTTISLLRLRSFIYLAALGKFILDGWALKTDQARMDISRSK